MSEAPKNGSVLALLDLVVKVEPRLRDHGDLLWKRTIDWHKVRRVPAPSLAEECPDCEAAGRSCELHAGPTVELEERIGDAAASRYKDELRAIANRLRADLARLVQIDAIVVRSQPKRLQGKDMLEAQVAADGWCVSCWRNDQALEPIQKRSNGDPYYRGLCRFCGGWKAEHAGQLPPLDVVQRHHDGRRIKAPAERSST